MVTSNEGPPDRHVELAIFNIAGDGAVRLRPAQAFASFSVRRSSIALQLGWAPVRLTSDSTSLVRDGKSVDDPLRDDDFAIDIFALGFSGRPSATMGRIPARARKVARPSPASTHGRRPKQGRRPERRLQTIQPSGSEPPQVGERMDPLNVRERKLEMKTTAAIDSASSQVEEPIRAELFGIERLEQHAESLAAAHRTAEKPPKGLNLLPEVRENARVLLAAYRNIAETVLANHEITPAAEWILDNFHVVDEQLRGIRDHLPGSYYRRLPKIAAGHLAGYPRVYGLAWAYVAHTDSRFELETLQRFVRAYQRAQPLTIGELWAVAIHLRVALVENLRRLSQLIIGSRVERARADEVADRLLGLSDRPAERPENVLSSLGDIPLARAFAVQLVQRLRGQDPSVLPVLAWLETKLNTQGTSADEAVAQEHQAQAAANVTVRNIITGMRWMSSIAWPDFFESVSLVDEILRTAPGFAAMDFATRNDYRARIELLSQGSGRTEIEVAREAVLLAR